MASVSFPLAPAQQQAPQLPAQQSVPAAPQRNATQQETVPRQDTVTLVGQTAENQQANQDPGSAQFGHGTAFYLAESQTFRASNGSQSQPPPNLPVQIKDETVLSAAQDQAPVANNGGPQASSAVQAANQATGASTANTAVASANADPAANAAPTNAAPNLVSATPQQQLAQLDQTLQEIGVNPESISLFNRMAMLLYANDPAALKVLVQNMQSDVPQALNANGSAPQAGGNVSAPQQSDGADSSAPTQSQTATPADAQTAALGQSPPANSQELAAAQNQGALNSSGPPANAAQNSLALRIEELQFVIAAVGSQGAGASEAASSQAGQGGQALDVTA